MHLLPVIERILYKKVYTEQKLWNQVHQMDVVTGSRPVPWGPASTKVWGTQYKKTCVLYDRLIIIIMIPAKTNVIKIFKTLFYE